MSSDISLTIVIVDLVHIWNEVIEMVLRIIEGIYSVQCCQSFTFQNATNVKAQLT